MPYPVLDAVASAQTTGTTLSYSITVAPGANALVVGLQVFRSGGVSVTAATYDGAAMTLREVDQRLIPSTLMRIGSGVWVVENPASGTKTISFTVTFSSELVSGAVSFLGADPSQIFGESAKAQADSTAVSVSVAATPGDDIVVDSVAGYNDLTASSLTVGASQTERWNLTQGASGQGVVGAGSTEEASGTPVTMTWTLNSFTTGVWVSCCVVVRGVSQRLLGQLGNGL